MNIKFASPSSVGGRVPAISLAHTDLDRDLALASMSGPHTKPACASGHRTRSSGLGPHHHLLNSALHSHYDSGEIFKLKCVCLWAESFCRFILGVWAAVETKMHVWKLWEKWYWCMQMYLEKVWLTGDRFAGVMRSESIDWRLYWSFPKPCHTPSKWLEGFQELATFLLLLF